MGKGERYPVRPRPDAGSAANIWQRAREDLILADGQGGRDHCLWEHAYRIGRTVLWIVSLPEVDADQLDVSATLAAALYKDAGWAVQVRQGVLPRLEVLSKATDDLQRDLAANLLEQRMRDSLSPTSLRKAALCIRVASNRRAASPEAEVLAEACDLCEIGLISFWVSGRRNALEGKALQSALEAWRTRKVYRYWEGRIESLRFESVRKVAVARLEVYDRFMTELEHECGGADLLPAPSGKSILLPSDISPVR